METELDKYLIPDLANIVTEYLNNPILRVNEEYKERLQKKWEYYNSEEYDEKDNRPISLGFNSPEISFIKFCGYGVPKIIMKGLDFKLKRCDCWSRLHPWSENNRRVELLKEYRDSCYYIKTNFGNLTNLTEKEERIYYYSQIFFPESKWGKIGNYD